MSNKSKTVKSKSCKYRCMMYEQQLKYLSFSNIDELQYTIESKINPHKYALIVHDKDEGVEPHVHVMLDFGKNARYITAIAKLFDDKPQFIQKWDKRGENGFAYLVHRTKSSKDKFQYSLSEVKANFDYAAMITEQTKKIEQRSAYTIKSRLDLLKIGAITSKQLIDELSGSDYAQYKRKIDDIERLRLEQAADKWREDMKAKGVTVKVLWIYGETGTGKSSVAKELADRLGQAFYMSGSSKDLFQEYNGEHTIILDELRPNTIPYQDFLRITDPHGMTETHTAAPSRYYDKALAADTVIITTPYSPYAFYQEMFDSPAKRRNDPFAQIERRITLTVMCTEDLICEVDFHSTNNGSFIVNSRNNPYSEKNRPQQTTDRTALAKLLFGDEGSEQDEKATDEGNHI